MVTESPVKRAPATLSSGNLDDYEESTDLDALLRDRERELNMYRSGSAPPTVEGSRAAFGSFFGHTGLQESHGINGGDVGNVISEEEIRSHPDYLSYYYSNGNFNPRLPPPALSKEDWRVAQRFRAGSIGDRRGRKQVGDGVGSSSSLFSLQPGIPMGGAEQEGMDVGRGEQRSRSRQASADWLEPGRDGLIGLPDVGLGVRRKSFADALQEKLGQPSPRSGRISRPISRNSFENIVTSVGASDLQLLQGSEIVDDLHSGATSPGLVRVQSVGSSISQSRLSGLGSSLARSRTPEPQLIRRSPSPCLPTVGGRMSDIDKNMVGDFNGSGGVSSHVSDIGEVGASLTSLSLSSSNMTNGENVGHFHQDFTDPHELLFKMQSSPNQSLQQKIINMPEAESYGIPTHPLLAQNDFPRKNGVLTDAELSNLNLNGQISRQMAPNNLYNKTASVGLGGSVNLYQDVDASSIDFTGSNSDAFSVNEATLSNHFDAGRSFMGGAERQHLSGIANQVGSGLHLSNVESLYAQHLQNTRDSAVQAALDPSLGRSFLGTSQMDLSAYQKAYLGAVLAQQKLQYAMPFANKSGGLNHGIYGNSAFSLGMQYPTSPIPSSLSPLGSGSPLRQNERLSRFPTMMRGAPGASLGSWNPESRLMEDGYGSSLLEEFKNNKARTFELLEIVGHVVEFSGDQYGSRFIQQKLETASVEEKNKIFPEIFPHARDLMTDVFGNYVIQKFFEHGTDIQRKQLASQLTGHVLSLSLQMYGCRVIQKALEVVDIDQQTQMVLELDGSIMKCVRDQNGNHVIQKCIECVPQERIQFIISSFYGQVVTLSAHPYGCRVIQRVLEHCDDAKTQSIMMDEILQSVCTLAQDQYGNYVVQHVLQHGKPEERSAIISKLAGQIVKMSQQKYASNVVEKCLTYGSSEERQILINEMLGSTDENEPLQAMMKDQFANYVVQKVIETCDDQNRELILSRIRVHLNALKRYTYGKHIVVRVEKLLTTGERRLGLSAYSS